MKIFLGSSREQIDELDEISAWIEEAGHVPLPWNRLNLFLPGDNTLSKLIEISEDVDAAIFIFGEDDEVWYRGDSMRQPRDNVLFEYGLFTGVLGHRRAIICRKGTPKTATDLEGMIYLNVTEGSKHAAKVKLRAWANQRGKQLDDPAIQELKMSNRYLREEKEALNDRLQFEQQKVADLNYKIRERTGFDILDFSTEKLMKLLYDFDFFWKTVRIISDEYEYPSDWKAHAKKFSSIVIQVRRKNQLKNSEYTPIYIAKTLRAIRKYENEEKIASLFETLRETARNKIQIVADSRSQSLSILDKEDI